MTVECAPHSYGMEHTANVSCIVQCCMNYNKRMSLVFVTVTLCLQVVAFSC